MKTGEQLPRGAVVRDWLSNCAVAGSVPTRLRWCALLKSSKQNKIAVQCSSQFFPQRSDNQGETTDLMGFFSKGH